MSGVADRYEQDIAMMALQALAASEGGSGGSKGGGGSSPHTVRSLLFEYYVT